jgi:hypothetical protein
MSREKQKEENSKKLVEVGADLLEDEALASSSEAQSGPQLALTELSDSESTASGSVSETPPVTPVSTATADVATQHKTPMKVLKSTIGKALPFVLVSVVVFCLPLLFSSSMTWLTYPQVRTYMLCALIWNLIGAVLYAQVDKRLARLMIVLIFALPLITSHWWAMGIYLIEMLLRSIFSIPP